MIGIGPFSIQVVTVFIALVLAWALARFVAQRLPDASPKAAGGMVFDALLWGLLAARLSFIAQWWEEYAAAPRSMIAIGDGGFTWWVGALVALAFVRWRTRARRALRPAVLVGIAGGVLAWLAAGGMFAMLHHSGPPLPELRLETLDARPVDLGSYRGRPVVLNLWATWCPPCRREMPAFEQAQAAFPNVAFVMVNQGESAQQAQAFLEREGLTLTDVLLDPSSRTMQEMGTRSLPTTLFFDTQGQLVASHVGELTIASLKDAIGRHFGRSLQSGTER